jgi:hypothetical protein
MTEPENSGDTEGSRTFGRGVVRLLLLVVAVVGLFWLGQSMVHHRFFRGGWMNQNDTIRP